MRLILLAFALSTSVAAQPSLQLAASPVDAGRIQVDGVLDEAAWTGAAVADGFVQSQPAPGVAATEATEARVLYDGRAVYVGMRMHDRGPVTTALGRRDNRLASDYASVVFDSYNDDRTAFQFEVNPSGVQRDFLFYDDVREDGSWDTVWDVATTTDADGWTAEFRIPLSQLRYATGAEIQEWGVQFTREIQRTGERMSWAPILPDVNGFVSRFGALTSLRGLESSRQLELLPYVASAVTRAPGDAADPFYDGTALDPRVGLDVKYGLTSDLTLTATVNPDFGQVEADPAQVNLGGFELFFREQRPFFVEGTDVFNMQPRRYFANSRPTLLYTRRIGRSPQRTSFVTAEAETAAGAQGTVYSDAPQQSTILGAAKVSGRVGRFTVGVLSATTASEYGRFQAFDERGQPVADGRALVEPLTTYLVGRTRATLGQNILGGLATVVARDTGDPAIDAMMPTLAAVGGVDIERPLGESWTLSGQIAGSVVTGSADAIAGVQTAFPRLYQRPDADHLTLDSTRTALSGLTGEINVLKTSGEHWITGFHGSLTTPGFDSNDLGFQSRADYVNTGGILLYQQTQPQGIFQRWQALSVLGAAWNTNGDRISTFLAGEAEATLRNFWRVEIDADVVPRFDDDRLTRGGPIARRDAGGSVSLEVETDSRKRVAAFGSTSYYGNELGRSGFDVGLGVEVRPSPSVTFSAQPSFGISRDPRQYVTAFDEPAATATFGRRYVFGDLDATTVSLETRLDWTFTPDLSLQLYARPFATRGAYSAFSDFDRPGAFRLPVFGVDQGTATVADDGSTRIDPGDGGAPFSVSRDFTFRSLQGNAVMRWQYRPGSALFVVWQQQREGFESDGVLDVGRDVGGLFLDTPTNVFLVKLSYWLG